MMTSLRRYTKYFLWFVAITFIGYIFLDWGMDISSRIRGRGRDQGFLAKVNGEAISAIEYQNLLNRNLDLEQERQGWEHDEKTLFDVEEATFDQIIQDHLIRGALREREVGISDEEVLNVIRFQPPPELENDTLLWTDGKFDPLKYQNLLQSPQNLPWLNQYETLIRQVLPRRKLELELASLSRTSQEEIGRALEVRREKVKVRVLHFDSREFPDSIPPVGESDLMAYFELHREDFQEPEKATLQYALFPREPSSEDEASTLQEIQEILKDIREGRDFGELAEEYSEDPSSREEGGDLGFLKEGQLEDALEEAIERLDPGEVSEPVRSTLGWHLLKVEEVKKGERHVRHLLLRVRASLETIASIEERAHNFREDVKEMDFKKAGEGYDVQVMETPPFERQGNLVPGLRFSDKISQFAFEGVPGEIKGPFNLRQGFVVVKLIERKPEFLPSYEETKHLIPRLVLEEKKRERTKELAARIGEEVRGGKSLKEVYQSYSKRYKNLLSLEETPLVSLLESEHNLPVEIFGTAYSLKVDEVSGLVETERGYTIVQLLERDEVEPDSLEAVRRELAQEILRQKSEVVRMEWLENLVKKAKIVDERYGY